MRRTDAADPVDDAVEQLPAFVVQVRMSDAAVDVMDRNRRVGRERGVNPARVTSRRGHRAFELLLDAHRGGGADERAVSATRTQRSRATPLTGVPTRHQP